MSQVTHVVPAAGLVYRETESGENVLDVRNYLATPARQASTLRQSVHRPWPPPEDRPWVQGQTWDDLLFAHWRLDEDVLRSVVPPQLPIDTFDGAAWLGITPFRISGFRIRGTLPVPRLSTFLELNVRTYVTLEEKPGIYFFSLDCESPIAVEAARRTYRLPYYRARMSARRDGQWIRYSSTRKESGERPFVFEGRYRATGSVEQPVAGSLEHFLTERYCLYTLDERQDVRRADIHHPPWPLQPAEAEIELNTMAPEGIELPDEEPLCHFARRQDVVAWALEPVAAPASTTRGGGADA